MNEQWRRIHKASFLIDTRHSLSYGRTELATLKKVNSPAPLTIGRVFYYARPLNLDWMERFRVNLYRQKPAVGGFLIAEPAFRLRRRR